MVHREIWDVSRQHRKRELTGRSNEEQNFVAIFHSDDITSMQKEGEASIERDPILTSLAYA